MFEKLFKYPFEEFKQGAVRLAAGLRPELAILAVVVAIAAAVYFYRRAPEGLSRRMRGLLAALRGLALGLLVLILFQPVLRTPLPVTRDCFVAVLVDDSRSMGIEDADPGNPAGRKSRLQVVKELLGASAKPNPGAGQEPATQGSAGRQAGAVDVGGMLGELTDICPVLLFGFSDQPKRIKGLHQITGTGDRTDLYSALRVVNTNLPGLPVVALVMLTDGADNAWLPAASLQGTGGLAGWQGGGSPAEMAAELGARNVPVYCVGFGDPQPPKDYEILYVQAPGEVRRNTSVEIHASVRSSGFTQPFNLILRGKDKVLDSVSVTPDPAMAIQRVRLSFRPDETDTGATRYSVEIPPGPDEVIVDNNRYDFVVKVIDKRLPVLYLEGSPREEYRFLRRALFRDKDFRIASILRVEGPKKFILQGAEPEDGLIDGFPKTKEHLYRFEALILGDIESTYLTSQQRQNVEAFVRERGGGLAMLGGVNSFNLGKYQNSEIEKMLPVVLPAPEVSYENREFTIALTKIGEEHPIMRQTENVLVNRNIWSKAATLVGFNPIKDVKPGAEVLAVEPRTGSPVLTVQNYGAGRVAAFTTGGSWHWQMAAPVEDELHEKFWKQLVRWLAVGSKGKLTIELNNDLFAPGEPVSIRSTVLDNVLKPVNDATVDAFVTDPSNNSHKLPQEWILSVEGVYQTTYEPVEVGNYRVEVVAEMKDGSKLTESSSFWVGPTLTEFTDAGQKDGLLKELADKSGGKYYTAGEASQIAEEVKNRVGKMKRDETVYETHDIWDTPLLFGLLALTLSVEWFLRRRAGLM